MDQNSSDNLIIKDSNLNFIKIFRTVIREKNTLFKFVALGIILGFVSIFTQKRVWEGVFQIVLTESKNKTISSNIPSQFSSFLELGNERKKLQTEIEILKSPSVLMPVFDFLKNEKLSKGLYFDTRFDKWKKANLDIQLERGTTVLNIAYKDTNKDLILDVLNKIANEYRNYSGKDKKIEKINSEKYFQKKLTQYEEEATLALEEVAQFEEKYNLGFTSDFLADDNKNSIKKINVEAIKLQASNSKRESLAYIEKIKELEENKKIKELVSLIKNIPEISRKSVNLKILNKIEEEIYKREKSFTNADKYLVSLRKSQKIAIERLIEESITILKGNINFSNSRISAAFRPPEVLSNYRKLLAKANNKSNAYIALEKEKIGFDLQSSKFETPWELITKPTLIPYPISPLKKRTLILFTLISFFLGLAFVINKENNRGIIFEKEDFDSLIPYPFLDLLTYQNINNWDESIKLIKSGILNNPNDDYSLLILNLTKNLTTEFNILEEKLKEIIQISKIKISTNISDVIYFENIILVFSLSSITKNELQAILSKLNLQKINIKGWILLSAE